MSFGLFTATLWVVLGAFFLHITVVGLHQFSITCEWLRPLLSYVFLLGQSNSWLWVHGVFDAQGRHIW